MLGLDPSISGRERLQHLILQEILGSPLRAARE